jgi:hypothetical protein
MEEFNKVCAWCKEPANEHVEGRQTTHGICQTCKDILLAPVQINQAIDERLPHPAIDMRK